MHGCAESRDISGFSSTPLVKTDARNLARRFAVLQPNTTRVTAITYQWTLEGG
jgi:hypothetical protein